MAFDEALKQELVVGLYDRGQNLNPKDRVLDIGSWRKLKSSIWSPYLVNLRTVLSEDENSSVPPEKQSRTKSLLLETMGMELERFKEQTPFFHIFGLPEAGTPLAAAVAGATGRSLLWQRVLPKPGYGNHQMLDGAYYPGQKVIQIDDVVTSGKTKNEGVEFLSAVGLEVPGVVIAFDREQGGREAVEASGLSLYAALGATASFGYLLEAGRITPAEHEYLLEYTATPPLQLITDAAPTTHPWN